MSEALVKLDYSNRDVIETIKNTVADGASDAQLAQFLEVCKSTGLNPFLKEVWCIAKTNTIMASRDGYLRVANEHPQFDGMSTHVERDAKNVPIKATCTVYRKDRSHPIICEAYFNEYQKKSNVWLQYPSAMISKVAEVLALKRSFAINGVVTEEEIGTETHKPRNVTPIKVLEAPPAVIDIDAQGLPGFTDDDFNQVPPHEVFGTDDLPAPYGSLPVAPAPKEPKPVATPPNAANEETKTLLRVVLKKMVVKDPSRNEEAHFQFLMQNNNALLHHIEKTHSAEKIKKLERALQEGEKWLLNVDKYGGMKK